MKKKILVSGSKSVLSDQALKPLIDKGHSIHRLAGRVPSDDDIISGLKDADGYLVGGFEYLSRELLEHSSKLECVALLGEDHHGFLDVPYASERGITITNTPGATTEAVAQFAIAQGLSLTRQLSSLEVLGRRALDGQEISVGEVSEFTDLKVGVLGAGRIGGRISEILSNAFGIETLYFSKTHKPALEDQFRCKAAKLTEIFDECAVIFVCLPATESTSELISRDLLNRGPRKHLISISKSTVFNVGALLDSLHSGSTRSAALDWIVNDEKLDVQRLLQFDSSRLLITPHIANNTIDAWTRMANSAVRSMNNIFLTGSDEFICNAK